MHRRKLAGLLLVIGGAMCLAGGYTFSQQITVPGYLSLLTPQKVSRSSGNVRWSELRYEDVGVRNPVITENTDFRIAQGDEFLDIGVHLKRGQEFRFNKINDYRGPYYIRCGVNTFTLDKDISANAFYTLHVGGNKKSGYCGEKDADVYVQAPNGVLRFHVEVVRYEKWG